MSGKWPGGFINKTAPTVVASTGDYGGSASGIWTLDQVADYEARGLWPIRLPPPTTGEIWSWGRNAEGQLGLGNNTTVSSPVQVGSLSTWTLTALGNYDTLAVKSDGTLWGWGRNAGGNLALGDTVSRNSPVQVGALTTWLKAAAGQYETSLFRTADGKLYAAGSGYQGGLGLGNTTNYSSPVQVGALTHWADIATGSYNSFATTNDGKLYAWGYNFYGELGNGTYGGATSVSSPIQVGSLTNWSTVVAGVYAVAAIKTDGTLWAWGLNHLGKLGINVTPGGMSTNRSSPTQVGALTTWDKVAWGNDACYAIKTDGTLWSWGGNTYGQCGYGTTTNYSSPVQVGALTTWSAVAGGQYFALGVRTDGILFAWGLGTSGQLGNLNLTNYSSPIQVGTIDTWNRTTLPKMVNSIHSVVMKTYGV